MQMDKGIYAKIQAQQKRVGSPTLCCVRCGESNPAVIEMHHVIGRSNSDEVIPLCKNCHAKITDEQNKLPREKRKGLSFILVSMGALIREIGTLLIDLGHEVAVNE